MTTDLLLPPDECEILDPSLAQHAGTKAWLGIGWLPKDPNHPINLQREEFRLEFEREGRARNEAKYVQALPSRYRTYTLDTLRPHAGNKAAIQATNDLTPGENLYIWGAPGNGKTHLAVATGRRLAGEGARVTFWGIVELFNTLRNSFSTGAERPNLNHPEILILDDLGKIKPTEFVYETFYGALEHRWANEKTTIFTANHRPSETARHMSTDPESAAAILSRMASGTVVEIRGKDERLPT